jgi:hypothetical protein
MRLAIFAYCFLLVARFAYSSTQKMELLCSSETSENFAGLHGVTSQKVILFKWSRQSQRERERERLAQGLTSPDVTCAGETRAVSRVTVVCINVLTCHRFKTPARHRYDKTRPLSLELPAQNGRTSSYCFSRGSLTRDKCFVQSMRPPLDLATVALWKISEGTSFIEQANLKKRSYPCT